MQIRRVERTIGPATLSLQTGKIAKQAHGAVEVRYGDSMVLAAAVEGHADPKRDFFPLTVDYREKTYAAGKFPGGFIKREGRPTTKEILTSRLIDRPIRPLFPASYMNEVQIMISTLSADKDFDTDVLAMIGGSAALHISHIPFLQPTGSVRVARVNGEHVLFPSYTQLEQSDLDLIVAGTAQRRHDDRRFRPRDAGRSDAGRDRVRSPTGHYDHRLDRGAANGDGHRPQGLPASRRRRTRLPRSSARNMVPSSASVS